MILNMACFYLILGACGILVHPLRKRPTGSAFHYVSCAIFAAGWALLPFGVLALLNPQNDYFAAYGVIGGLLFVVIFRRGIQHVQLYIDQYDYPY